MRPCCLVVPVLLAAGCHAILPLAQPREDDGPTHSSTDRGVVDAPALDLQLDLQPESGVVTKLAIDTSCSGGLSSYDGANPNETKVSDRGSGVAFDAKGRYVVLGALNGPAWLHGAESNLDIVIRRSLADGTPDPDFGGAGKVTIDLKNWDFSSDVVALSSGKLLVGGNVDQGTDNPTAWRLMEDGSPDLSFSDDGRASLSVSGEVQGKGLAVSGSDYYLLGSQGENWFVVGRLTTDGALDTTFGNNGKVVFNTVPMSHGEALAVAPDGKIMVVGKAHPGGATADSDMALWRFTADGKLDASFGIGGYLLHDGAAGQPGSDDQGLGLTIDSAGEIYVAGLSHNGTDNDLALWKVRGGDGTLDPGFNKAGYRVHHGAAGGGGNDDGRGVIQDGGGLLVVGASQSTHSGLEMTIWRFTLDGTLDTTLNGTGHFSHGRPHADRGISIAASGSRLVVVGTSSNGTDNDLAVWCLSRTP